MCTRSLLLFNINRSGVLCIDLYVITNHHQGFEYNVGPRRHSCKGDDLVGIVLNIRAR